MRIILFITSLAITIGLVLALNSSLTIGKNKTPRFGVFFSPQHGFWKNADPTNSDFNSEIIASNLGGKVDVYFDERLVPHVYAEKENDAYYVQGYLHAKFRLWQMEFQTHVAAGRLSEIMGNSEAFLGKDRFFKRLGMVAIAEKSLKENETNPEIKSELDAYTAGVNAYIETLTPANYPLEYKVLDYAPEKWTNLKSQLLLKYMSFDLAGYDSDFEMSNMQTIFSAADIEKLYPLTQDSLAPIIPAEAVTKKGSLTLKKPADVGSLYYHNKSNSDSSHVIQPDKNNGSNNWAVAGSKTKSGAPILCNDPHLALNLPSLWYEMQISTPTFNSYGATIPGAPSIIIGFNDHCAWGVTNAVRDVKDYYEMQFKDSTMNEYFFQGKWKKASFRYDTIKIKGAEHKVEKIALTVLGPVMYDKSFPNILKNEKYYALRWVAQDASNEFLAFNKLNHAKNYNDFLSAITAYGCPGQNFVFASKAGDIALQQQGRFPAKWERQGDFLMPGSDSSYAWQAYIPASENPAVYNPKRGFVSSANQLASKSYPYYLAGKPFVYRGVIINRMLSQMSDITTQDMQLMQVNNYDVFAEQAKPLLLKYLDIKKCTPNETGYINTLKSWNLKNDYDEVGPTILDKWWRNLKNEVFNDEFKKTSLPVKTPDNSTLVEALLKDSTYKFVDNINTPATENLRDIISLAFKKASKDLDTAKQENYLPWGKYKNTEVKHILNMPSFSRLSLPIGGSQNSINATTKTNGPGWRMIVELTKEINAYGIYAGGQSGNPGSKYYDNFIDNWASGKYFKLIFLNWQKATTSNQFKWKMTFSKA
ncbi:MAG: penicillin acylase family protein [Pyrinomonadaceae bacterium]|nr:penicillin acylase family protein [Sphingobacteriaceae bacterium]